MLLQLSRIKAIKCILTPCYYIWLLINLSKETLFLNRQETKKWLVYQPSFLLTSLAFDKDIPQ